MKNTLILAALAMGVFGCGSAPQAVAPVGPGTFQGMCDASAVVSITDDLFVVGDDEDSVLRVYSRAQGGRAVHRVNVSTFLGFKAESEADIEGAARIGSQIYWITSHGNNRKGKEQESRQRFFATIVKTNGGTVDLVPAGASYNGLLDDLLAHPALRNLNLKAALDLPPKTPGALNIEGLAATPDGSLLIGFRNPVPEGKALIVPLLNPSELVSGRARPQFGKPLYIDLGGYGIRSIEGWRNGYLVVAGSITGKGKSRLYYWRGEGAPEPIDDADFEGINPEAVSVIPGNGIPELLIVSDDGARKVNGVDCKQLKDPDLKTFRAVSVRLPLLATKP